MMFSGGGNTWESSGISDWINPRNTGERGSGEDQWDDMDDLEKIYEKSKYYKHEFGRDGGRQRHNLYKVLKYLTKV